MHSSEEYDMNNDWREYYDPQYVLMHHGILGQKWGVRRFQNADGTLTAAGKKKYGDKVTMHTGKSNLFIGGAKYQTHKEYETANKFAKGTYLQRKQEIKEKRNASFSNSKTLAGKVGALTKAVSANKDNKAQYKYELARNRHNAGKEEFKREIVKGAANNGAKQAAKIGAGIVAGMLTANYMNNQLKKSNAGALPMKGMDNYYEYKVGKAQVAKLVTKAVAVGAITGAATAVQGNFSAESKIRRQYMSDVRNKVDKTRAKRAAEDEKKWKKGQV